jgi:hypothetical protein
MRPGFGGQQWFGGLQTFTAAQRLKLNQLCATLTTNSSVSGGSLNFRSTVRLGLGGINFYGNDGLVPFWMQAISDLLGWINSIGPDPDVIVTACVGSDCR